MTFGDQLRLPFSLIRDGGLVRLAISRLEKSRRVFRDAWRWLKSRSRWPCEVQLVLSLGYRLCVRRMWSKGGAYQLRQLPNQEDVNGKDAREAKNRQGGRYAAGPGLN